MIGHLSLGVRDLDRAQAFYDAVLAPLGFVRLFRSKRCLGYGPPGGNDRLALFLENQTSERLCAGPGFHLAFSAPDRGAVDDFYAAAMQAGGRGDGEPGLRPAYSASYYAAFVLDPDGHKLEAVHQ